jgi:hypothetical protein
MTWKCRRKNSSLLRTFDFNTKLSSKNMRDRKRKKEKGKRKKEKGKRKKEKGKKGKKKKERKEETKREGIKKGNILFALIFSLCSIIIIQPSSIPTRIPFTTTTTTTTTTTHTNLSGNFNLFTTQPCKSIKPTMSLSIRFLSELTLSDLQYVKRP